jgi:hypothetical protein
MTFFRVQTADRDVQDLIDPARGQMSYSWFGPESYDQPGVSVCASLRGLAEYLAHSGVPYGVGDWVIVELEGEEIYGSTPMDAEYGEILVYPTEIISVRPMDEAFFAMIGEAYDAIGDE